MKMQDLSSDRYVLADESLINSQNQNNNQSTEQNVELSSDEKKESDNSSVVLSDNNNLELDKSNEHNTQMPDGSMSVFAKALAETGILSSISEEDLNSVNDVASLYSAMQKEVDARLSYEQKRVLNALNAGVEPNEIQQYESLIHFLNDMTPAELSKEDAHSEEIRKNIIFQFYKETGLSDEIANDMVARSVKDGKDIDDAIKYSQHLKELYSKSYQNLIDEGKKRSNELKDNVIRLREQIKSDDNFFGGLRLSPQVREQIANNWLRPAFRDDNNNTYTPIQKYIDEKPEEYMKNVAMFFTLTDGFTNFKKLSDYIMNKEKNQYTKELENILSNPHKYSSGNSFVGSDNSVAGENLSAGNKPFSKFNSNRYEILT